jgi:Zn-dependent protease
MPEYLRLDSRKITFREYWNITHSINVIIPWVAKLLHIPMKFGSGHQRVEAVQELEIPETAFSLAALDKLQVWLDQCLTLGFHTPRFYNYKSLGGETEISFITLLHNSGECSVRLMYTVSTAGTSTKVKTLAAILTGLNDDTFLTTGNQRAMFLSPPEVNVNRIVNGNPAQVLELHQRKLSELQVRNRPRKISSQEAMDAIWNRYEKLCNDFGVKRGIYVPLQSEEREAAVKRSEAVKELKAQGVENADVLAALSQLQDKKGNWVNVVLIFIVSMILFVGIGAKQWSWRYALMLVPILFVHELGHYLAMRSFNYRNLRMFFIPFFGAAVSGRNYNVPGWKKVVVSLMGPVPGIVLGVLVGSVGLVLHQTLLIKLALVALILNGFNLLPVLPLDGGWIFHTLIFSRHYLLDAAFRVVAAIALILLGAVSGSKILMYLGIPMLIGIPAAYRMARVVTTLRRRGVPLASADDQTIPTETAQTIIAELKQVLPKVHTTKMVADQTLQVFETLNARPPGWLATLGLLFVHFASVVMAIIFSAVLVVGQRGDFTKMLSAAGKIPKNKLACNSIAVWRGKEAPKIGAGSPNTLIATFPGNGAAEKAYQSLTNQLPANASLKCFGESLLLSLPMEDDAARKEWLARFKQQTKNVFVDNTNSPALFSLTCTARTEEDAKEMESELAEYLNTLPYQFLVPPWMPDDRRSDAQRAQDHLARRTYLKLLDNTETDYNAPEMRTLQKKMADVRKQGDKAGMENVRKEIRQFSENEQKRHISKSVLEKWVRWIQTLSICLSPNVLSVRRKPIARLS